MRLILNIAGAVAVMVGLGGTSASAQFCGNTVDCDWPLPDVAHYTFDDIDTDIDAVDSINGNTATWGGPVGGNVPVGGVLGGAHQQQGGSTTSYNIDGLPELNGAGGFSVAMWFNESLGTAGASGRIGLISNRSVVSSWGTAIPWGIHMYGGNPHGIDARIGNNGVGTNLPVGAALSGGGTFAGVPADQEWHHIALTWNGGDGEQALYIDGALVDSSINAASIGGTITTTNGLGTANADTPGWVIGRDNCCGDRGFDGSIDDTGFWSTAISATDVQQIYQAGLAGINLSLLEPPQPGDVDLDGDVDSIDFDAIQANFFTEFGAERSDGDLTGGGVVDWADFRIWRDNFPFTPSNATAAVPEPASILVVAAACCGFGLARRRC